MLFRVGNSSDGTAFKARPVFMSYDELKQLERCADLNQKAGRFLSADYASVVVGGVVASVAITVDYLSPVTPLVAMGAFTAGVMGATSGLVIFALTKYAGYRFEHRGDQLSSDFYKQKTLQSCWNDFQTITLPQRIRYNVKKSQQARIARRAANHGTYRIPLMQAADELSGTQNQIFKSIDKDFVVPARPTDRASWKAFSRNTRLKLGALKELSNRPLNRQIHSIYWPQLSPR